MTLGQGEVLESPDRLIVPFWNWSSISVEESGPELERRLVFNSTDDSNVNCSDFVTVPYNFTVLLTAGCTIGVLVAIYIIFRAYRLLLITYCVSLSRQTDEGGRVSAEGFVVRLPRVRRCQAKTDSPPPPYDSPPPYHVAVVMGREEGDPPPEMQISGEVYI